MDHLLWNPSPKITIENVAILLATVIIAHTLFQSLHRPNAPGPFLARWTDLWYTFYVWKGQFHRLNIAQHMAEGPIVRVAPNMYSIDDPDAVKILYGIGSKFIKSRWYDAWNDPTKPQGNLFTSRDEAFHSKMKSKLAGLYSMTSIRTYEPLVDESIAVLVKELDKFSLRGAAFDLQTWMQYYAFDTITAITYGKRLGFMDGGGRDLGGIILTIDKVNSFFTMFGISRLLLPLWLLLIGNTFPGLRKFITLMDAEADKAASAFKSAAVDFNDESNPTAKSIPFYFRSEALRLKDPETFKKLNLEAGVGANIGAGSDTTSIALTSILYECSKNPSIWKQLQVELDQAITSGEVSSPITFQEAQKLVYFQRVLKEAYRVHPSVGLPMWRDVPESGAVIANQFFPSGTVVGINPFVAHYNKKVYGMDSETFNPDRWDRLVSGEDQVRKMEAYSLTFGHGKRSCIGKNISLLEINKLLPELVRRYDFELIDSHKELEVVNHWFPKQRNILVKVSPCSAI